MPEATQTATLGGGCFWCLEAVFQELDGVIEVFPGYAGGHLRNPAYREVCRGDTGHAEVIRITFDPERLDYATLLAVFMSIHDPTQRNRQGNDVGPQYRSIILTHDEQQAATARETLEQFEQEGVYDDPIVTEIQPCEAFYAAEAEHRNFYRRNSAQPYCQAIISPKLSTFRRRFADRLNRT